MGGGGVDGCASVSIYVTSALPRWCVRLPVGATMTAPAHKVDNKNLFYAVKVRAVFDYSTVRTEPRQKKPHPPLVAVAKRQPVYVRGYVRA